MSATRPAQPSPTASPQGGILYVVGCYLIWGFFPLYFLLTSATSPLEMVAERVVFSLLLCLALVPLTGQGKALARVLASPRQVIMLGCAGVLIFINWLLYIVATTSNNVMEASLGYYINPIVTVALGVAFLGERLRPLQWAGIGVAALAVLVMVVFYGSVPWLSLGLAFSFGIYGLLKKQAGQVPAVVSLTLETLILSPIALVLLAGFVAQGELSLLSQGPAYFWLLAASGLVTTVPLILFAAGAARVPLSVVGMIQYMTPTLQFLLALFVTQEHLNAGRWAGFILIWVAAALFILDTIRTSHRR